MIIPEWPDYQLLSAGAIALYYLVYKLWVGRSTAFRFNRIFILGSLLACLVLPLLHFDLPVESVLSDRHLSMPNYLTLELGFENASSQARGLPSGNGSFDVLGVIYLLGMLLAAGRYLLQLIGLYALIRKHPSVKKDGYRYILQGERCSVFSFWNCIFLNYSTLGKKDSPILVHERAHVDQRHTLDLLLIEVMIVLQWFNPFIYFFKRRLVETHEFLADRAVIEQGYSSIAYQKLLLESARKQMVSLTHHFHQPQIKKRIIMLSKYNNQPFNYFKLVLVLVLTTFLVLLNGFRQHHESWAHNAAVSMENPLLETLDLHHSGLLHPPSFIFPIRKQEMQKISSGYGMRLHPVTKRKRKHNGIDILAPHGTDVLAAETGTVAESGYDEKLGNYLILHHEDNFLSAYNHLSERSVQAGQTVKQGAVIGKVGSTGVSSGPHLHFEIGKIGKDREDPTKYLP